MAKPMIGDILVENGVITQKQLDKALEVQKRDGGLVGIILVSMGHITEDQLTKTLTMQAKLVVDSN